MGTSTIDPWSSKGQKARSCVRHKARHVCGCFEMHHCVRRTLPHAHPLHPCGNRCITGKLHLVCLRRRLLSKTGPGYFILNPEALVPNCKIVQRNCGPESRSLRVAWNSQTPAVVFPQTLRSCARVGPRPGTPAVSINSRSLTLGKSKMLCLKETRTPKALTPAAPTER